MLLSVRLVLLCALPLLACALLVSSASAYVALPSGVTPVVTPPNGGGLVELSNGEYALYGPGGEEAQAMKLYTAAEEATLARRATGVELDSGVTGQDASAVEGSSSADVEAVDAMHAELVADGPEEAANGVVNEITTGSRVLGVLPDLGEIGSALLGGVEIAGGAVAVVGIATGIDELLGLPTLFHSGPATVSTSHGYIEEFADAGEQWVEMVPCNSAIAGSEPMVYRANGDHCLTLYELVSDTFVPIEPECVERFGSVVCEHLGGVLRKHGILIDPASEVTGIARFPNAEALPNGVIAIFRDLEAEVTDKELPHTTGLPEHFSHSPSIPTVPTPEPVHEPVPARPLPAIPPELQDYLGSVDPALGHGEGGAVPSPIDVNRVAKALAENNPESELSKEKLKLAAGQCLELTAAAGSESSTDCETLPIFISGSDVPSATSHDLQALQKEPAWVRLNYSNAKEKAGEEARRWYVGLPGCEGENPPGESCDEYPFFATAQGGGSALPTPSIKFINHTDNVTQGGLYGNFVSACKMATRSATGYAFLAVPLPPSLEVPTTRLCN